MMSLVPKARRPALIFRIPTARESAPTCSWNNVSKTKKHFLVRSLEWISKESKGAFQIFFIFSVKDRLWKKKCLIFETKVRKNSLKKTLYLFFQYMETRSKGKVFLTSFSVYGENASLELITEKCLPHRVLVRIETT